MAARNAQESRTTTREIASSAWDTVPDDVASRVLSFLNVRSASTFRRCSKSVYRRVGSYESLWRELWDRSLFSRRRVATIVDRRTATTDLARALSQRYDLLYRRCAGGDGDGDRRRRWGVPDRCVSFRSLTTPPSTRTTRAARWYDDDQYAHAVVPVCSLVDSGVDGACVVLSPRDGSVRAVRNVDPEATSGTDEHHHDDDDDDDEDDEVLLRGATDDDHDLSDWLGVEAKHCGPLDDRDLMIAVRCRRNGDGDGDGDDDGDDVVWTQVLAWKKRPCSGARWSDDAWESRFLGAPYFVDVCGCHDKVYAIFRPRDDPWSRSRNDDDDDGDAHDHGRTVRRFSLVPRRGSERRGHRRTTATTTTGQDGSEFRSPESASTILAYSAVRCFAVDADGETLILGCQSDTCEIWDTGLAKDGGDDRAPRRLRTLFARRYVRSFDDNEDDDNRGGGAIVDVSLSRHLPVRTAGFVSLHESSSSSLGGLICALWRPRRDADDGRLFAEPSAMIVLPPTDARPLTRFDGRRLVVSTHDRVGRVVYVYALFRKDDDEATRWFGSRRSRDLACAERRNNNRPPVVLTYDDDERLWLVNQIRLEALGWGSSATLGSATLTCNERYIVTSIERGNLARRDERRFFLEWNMIDESDDDQNEEENEEEDDEEEYDSGTGLCVLDMMKI